MPRSGILWFLVLPFLFFIGSCRDLRPVRVGLMAELSGPFRDLGIEGRDGALLAVEEINRNGGIGGRKLTLVLADCGFTRIQAEEAFHQLEGDGLKVLLGPMTSTQGMVLLPLINDSGVLCVGISTSSDKFGGQKDQFYRMTPSTGQMAREMALYLAGTGFDGSMGIVYDRANADYSFSMVQGMKEGFDTQALPPFREYPFDSRDRDFPRVMDRMAEDPPEALYFVASARDTAILAQYGRSIGYTGQYYSSFWAGTDDLPAKGGRSVEGMILPCFYTEADKTGSYKGFRQKFANRYGRNPNYFSVFGYESVYLLASAFERGDLPFTGSPHSFTGFPSQEGVVGMIAFDEYGDCLREMKMVRIEDGRFMPAPLPEQLP